MHDAVRLETITGFSPRPLRPRKPIQRLVDLEKSSRPQGTVEMSVEPKESRRRAEPQGNGKPVQEKTGMLWFPGR